MVNEGCFVNGGKSEWNEAMSLWLWYLNFNYRLTTPMALYGRETADKKFIRYADVLLSYAEACYEHNA